MPSDNDERLVVLVRVAVEALRSAELHRAELALDADLAGELALDRLVREVQRAALDLLGLRLRRVQVLDLLLALVVLVQRQLLRSRSASGCGCRPSRHACRDLSPGCPGGPRCLRPRVRSCSIRP